LSENNENKEKNFGGSGRPPQISTYKISLALLAASAIWGAVFGIIGLSGPISKAFSEIISGLSELLDISVPAVWGGMILSAYITIAMLLMLNPNFRKSFARVSNRILKQEKSFHLGSTAARMSLLGLNVGSDYSSKDLDDFSRRISERIANVESKISIPADVKVSKEDWEAIQSNAVDSVTKKLTGDVSERLKQRFLQDRIVELENASLARLSDQIVVLGSRANLALYAGVIFCVGGLAILWSTLANVELPTPEAVTSSLYWAEFLKVFAPRLSLVLIVEIIGFFFLKWWIHKRSANFVPRY